MSIYMTHPEHGAMHVYAEAEAQANEKAGWKRAPEPVAKPAVENVAPIRPKLALPKGRGI